MPGNRAALCRHLEGEGLVVAPGVFDMISAQTADRLGFDAFNRMSASTRCGTSTAATARPRPEVGAARPPITRRLRARRAGDNTRQAVTQFAGESGHNYEWLRTALV
jgi:hypothetical protein